MRDWCTADPVDDIPPAINPEDYGVHGRTKGAEAPRPVILDVMSAADFIGKAPPDRPWLVKDWVPRRAVTMMSGDGGVGKSLAAVQLGLAVATGTDWLGTLPETGPVLYISAEDDTEELHRRIADNIAGRDHLEPADLDSLKFVALAGKDAVMAVANRGVISGTPLWQALRNEVAVLGPRLVIIDNLADAFAGNENIRVEARQFVGLLRGMAIEHDLAVLLIAHPSLTGLSSGTGTSGSTAWSNSVRSRLYLDRAKSDDGDEPDPALRVLKLMKANYAPTGAEIRIRWEAGRFRPEAGASASAFDRIAQEARAEKVFLALLKRFAAEGREVSHKRSPSFAPAVFAKQHDSQGCTKASLEKAMERLLADRKIRVEPYGPPSRNYSRIVEAEVE